MPLLAALALAHVVGDAWPDNATLAWRGHLDEGLRAAGRVVGDQLAPTLTNPALRFFAIADITLILGALAIVAWRRIRRLEAFHAINARFHPALAVTAIGLCLGLAIGGGAVIAQSTTDTPPAATAPAAAMPAADAPAAAAWRCAGCCCPTRRHPTWRRSSRWWC